jgi:2-polyprenyl-3-methyl-5-hydroxy-6-metoxy-1,4-benzoquinol methylase
LATIHGPHTDSKIRSGSQTASSTLHNVSQYDIHTSLLGLGVSHSNSKMIVEMARIKPGDQVLDVGCGSGNLTLTAKRYTWASGAVYRIDAAPEMIEVPRKKAQRSGTAAVFEVDLIEKLPYPERTFDVVMSRLVIHHLPDNPILAHVATAVVGHKTMMESKIDKIPLCCGKPASSRLLPAQRVLLSLPLLVGKNHETTKEKMTNRLYFSHTLIMDIDFPKETR